MADGYAYFAQCVSGHERQIAKVLGHEVTSHVRSFYGADYRDLEDKLEAFFADVATATGQRLTEKEPSKQKETRSKPKKLNVEKYTTLLSSWRVAATQRTDKEGRTRNLGSTNLAVAAYYYLYTIKSGQIIVEKIDKTIFKMSFADKIPGGIPGAYLADVSPARNTSATENEKPSVQAAPTLRLDPKGGDTTTGYQRFIDYVYSSQNTDFEGRSVQMQALKEFLEKDDILSWWQIAGEGGQGKSRTALELVQHADSIGWHAGFLRHNELKSITDWRTLKLDGPTLCIIDYVASPAKADMAADMLINLYKRQDDTYKKWGTPLNNKLRILLIDRAPYNLTSDFDYSNDALWFDAFSKKGDFHAVIKTAYKAEALTLNDLSSLEMVKVAQSWRHSQEHAALTEQEEVRLTSLLSNSDDQRKRAWRPLLAMVLADIVAATNLDNLKLGDALKFALQDEANKYWIDIDGRSIKFSAESKRLASLATIIGSLNIKEDKLNEHFYGCSDVSHIEQAWTLLGQRKIYTKNNVIFNSTFELLGRTPDILGEYMIHLFGLTEQENSQIMNDAWRLNSESTMQFLINLSKDADDLEIANTFIMLAGCIPDFIDLSQFEEINVPTIYAFYLGLTGLRTYLEREIKTPLCASEFDISPLLLATIGKRVAVSLALIGDERTDVNSMPLETGNYPLLFASAYNQPAILHALLSHRDIRVNTVNPLTGAASLIEASDRGHTNIVDLLLNSTDIDVNITNDKNGSFPLREAANKGHVEAVKSLLKKDSIDVNKVNPVDNTFALLMASGHGHYEVVELLCENGANVGQIWAGHDVNCLELAIVQARDCDEETQLLLFNTIKVLLKYGATFKDGTKPEFP